MAPSLRLLSFLGVALSTASCDGSWMEQRVRLQDGTEITLQHRFNGTFRTIVANQYGDVSADYNGAADSRHVNLYKSPSGRIIIADYGIEPMIIEVGNGHPPVEVGANNIAVEYGLSGRWKYLGSVRRTDDDNLRYFPDDPECQSFRIYKDKIRRKVVPCDDANYVGPIWRQKNL